MDFTSKPVALQPDQTVEREYVTTSISNNQLVEPQPDQGETNWALIFGFCQWQKKQSATLR